MAYKGHKEWHDKGYATTTAGSIRTVLVLVVENKQQSLVADGIPKSCG